MLLLISFTTPTGPTLNLGRNIYFIWVKATGFEWNSEQENDQQQIQTAVQAALPFGLYGAAYMMDLGTSVVVRDAVLTFGMPL